LPAFDYRAAFSRNLGWVTPVEQNALRDKRVAIAGLGGVGGAALLTLARMGIGKFNIADFDTFELPNFNRQSGATITTLGHAKVEVMRDMALDVNPELAIELYPSGVNEANLPQFLTGVDLVVDCIDYFCQPARAQTYDACRRAGVPVLFSAPLGMGATIIAFTPGGMSFEDYFGLAGCDEREVPIRFMVGISPRLPQRHYLAHPESVDLLAQRVPSLAPACQLSAGLIGVFALKLLLGRGGVKSAPHSYQFDAYESKLLRSWRPWGHRNPLQALGSWVAKKKLGL
jgi:threonine dehydrogenase-like Zn-dependent dehydrogenase